MRYAAVLICVLIAARSFAGVINVSNSSALNAANEDAVAGDTVKLAAGTYTVAIAPVNSGSSGSPIVYMPATAGAVCSLYVVGTVVSIVDVDYIIVQNLRLQMGLSNNWVVNVSGSDHSAILNCYIYGGALRNVATNGDWPSVRFNQTNYCRLIGNIGDRQDNVTLTTSDSYRGDWFNLYGSASDTKYNIIEGNTVYNASHYGIGAPYDLTGGDSYNIIRFNTTYNCHVGIGTMDANQRTLVEGNRSYSPSQMLTYRWGIAFEGTTQYGIFRFNEFYDDSVGYGPNGTGLYMANATMTQGPGSLDHDNRYYGNAFLGQSRNATEWHSFAAISDAGMSAYDQGRSVFINNIFGPSIDGYGSVPYYWKDADDAGVDRDTLRNNLFWTGHTADTVAKYDHGSTYAYTLAGAKSAETTFEASNIEASPLWVDSLSLRGSRSFQIAANSPCVDAGAALTTVASNVSSSTVVTVGDAGYFHYDWGGSPYDRGDSVAFISGGVIVARGELDSVDYANRRLILKSAISVSAGASVHVLATYKSATASYVTRLSGSAPDIGPYERTTTGGGGSSLPGSTTLVAPDSNGSQMQPVTFRWRSVSGATRYWFSLSGDNWGSLLVNNATLTDTFVTVSGITPGTWCVWNVATGNADGWNTDAWSSWWTVEMGEVSAAGDTLTVDWNRVITDSTLTSSTLITMANVQRVSTTIILRNPNGYTVEWPSSIKWLGLSSAPQPTAGDTCAYEIVRGASGQLYGRSMSASGTTGGVTASWVYSQLASYLKYTNPTEPPSSESDTGTAGEFRYDSGYIYFCTATNTWVRWSVSTTW